MDFMFDWDAEGDRFSFDDSDRFEEDSLCSWMSEPESLCNNWRGWKRQNSSQLIQNDKKDGKVLSLKKYLSGCLTSLKNNISLFYSTDTQSAVPPLLDLTAQVVAAKIAFEEVERFYPPIPEELQLKITYWSFPKSEEDIR